MDVNQEPQRDAESPPSSPETDPKEEPAPPANPDVDRDDLEKGEEQLDRIVGN